MRKGKLLEESLKKSGTLGQLPKCCRWSKKICYDCACQNALKVLIIAVYNMAYIQTYYCRLWWNKP